MFPDRERIIEFFLSKLASASTKNVCTQDIQRIIDGYKKRDPISMAVFDSMGRRPPETFNVSRMVDLGDMATCVAVNNMQPSPNINLQHCVMKYLQAPILGFSEYGVCAPKSCSMNDLKSFVEIFLKVTKIPTWTNITFNQEWCRSGEYNVDNSDLIILCILVILLTLVFSSTIYDLYESKINKGTSNKLFSSFSLNRNLREFFKVQPKVKGKKSSMFRSMFGIRVLSIFWIIYGHTLLLINYFPSIKLNEANAQRVIPAISQGYGVECFFVMSGCLCAYGVFRGSKGLKLKDVPSFIIKRYIRLTPLIAVVIMLQVIVGKYLRSQWPHNEFYQNMTKNCVKKWWLTLVYGQNFIRAVDSCLPHTWYMAVDFQLFIIATVILIITKFLKKRWVIYGFIATIAFASISWVMYNAYYYKVAADPEFKFTLEYGKFAESVNVKPQGRAPAFLIGMILGLWLALRTKNQNPGHFSNKSKSGRKRVLRYLGWIFMIGVLGLDFYGYKLFDTPEYRNGSVHKYFDGVFIGFHRPAFALIVALLIAYSETGHGGVFGWLLSIDWLQPLGKLTYSLYLVHFPFMYAYYLMFGTPIYHTLFTTFTRTVSVYGVSILLCIPLYVCVELPFSHLATILFQGPKKPNRPQEILPVTNPQPSTSNGNPNGPTDGISSETRS